MPIIESAKKALRASRRKAVFNRRRKDVLHNVVRDLKKLVTEGKKKEATAKLSSAYQAIDKAAKNGVIKKNTASRKKARLAALLKRTA